MSPADPNRPGPGGTDRAQQMRAWSAGLDIAVGLVAGGILGWLMDRWLGHAPWWMLGLGLAGLLGGLFRFFREAMALNRPASDRFRERSRHAGTSPEKADPPTSPDA